MGIFYTPHPTIRRIIPVLLFFVCSAQLAVAQHDAPTNGAASKGMGGAFVMQQGFWSAAGNVAGLGFAKGLGAGAYFDSPYNIKELSTKAVALAYGGRYGSFGLTASYYGFELYNQSSVGLAFARELVPQKLAMGVKFGLFSMAFAENYGKRHVLVGELGIQYFVTPKFGLGMHVYNVVPQEISDEYNQKLPTRAAIGLLYRLGKQIDWQLDLEKWADFDKPNLRTGFAFQWYNHFFLRAGVQTYPFSQSVGFGLAYSNLRADIAFARQDPFGYTPHVSLSYGL